MFGSPGLKLVEWPEKAGEYLPQCDLTITIDLLPDETRSVQLSAFTSAGAELIA